MSMYVTMVFIDCTSYLTVVYQFQKFTFGGSSVQAAAYGLVASGLVVILV